MWNFDDNDGDDELKDQDFFPEISDSNESSISENTANAGFLLESNLLDQDKQLNCREEILDNIAENERESRAIKKSKRNTGKAYTTSTGNLVRAREFKLLVDCRKKCKDKITPENQKDIFEKHWVLGDYKLRHAYVCGLIVVEEKKSERKFKITTRPRNRNYAYYYFLELNANRISVCQKCFRSRLSESEQFIKTVVKKKLESFEIT